MSINETHVTIRGRLCADPTVFTTRAGAPMSKFRVAQSSRRQVSPGQWEDTEPSFYDVLAYRSLAANVGVSLKKGHPVTVHGRQRVVQWRRDDGQVFVNVEIDADAVGHDLTYGTTAFAKVGLGRPAEGWSQWNGRGADDEPTGADAGDERSGGVPGDPEHDPYVVEPGPGRGPGEVGLTADGAPAGGPGTGGHDDGEAAGDGVADTGPLVRPGKGAAA
jgi:single-strand DNA-binding protein